MQTRLDLSEDVFAAKVLIVDDMLLMQKMIGLTLSRAGYKNLFYADDGDVALEMVSAQTPDLVILDLNMPNLSGYEVCKTLRANPRFETLPILVQSASEAPEERVEVFDSGATDFVSKPINQPELLARVRMHLENRLLIRNLQNFQEHMNRELSLARNMQHAILPNEDDIARIERDFGIEIGHRYQASYELGGDLWGLWSLDADHVGVFVLDVSGHGVGSALNTFRVKSVIDRYQAVMHDPADFLARLNGDLADSFALGQFATVFYATLNCRNGELLYAGAGAPRPFITSDGHTQLLDSSGVPLGISERARYENKTARLGEGETLFCYSDVLLEAPLKKTGMLGEDGLLALFSEQMKTAPKNGSTAAPLEGLLDVFFETLDGALPDDLTAVTLSRRMAGGAA